MSLSALMISAKPISGMRRSFQSMKIMKSYAAFVMNKCAKSIQALASNLKVLGSIRRTSNCDTLSDLQFYK